LEEMSEEKFGLQARGVEVFLREKIGAFLDGFEDGHGGKARKARLRDKG